MLKLPQITLATASVFLHRFFMRHPMIADTAHPQRQHQHYYSVAAACLFLASKVEENCRKMKDLVVACVRVAQKSPSKEVDDQDKEFWRWRDTILALEDILLEALCFDLMLESPYTTLYNLLIQFRLEEHKGLRNAAWTFVNDSCLTPLCLLYPPHTIAASAIYCAARHCDVRLLDDEYGRPWWEGAGVDLVDMRRACNFIADLYEGVPGKGGVEKDKDGKEGENGGRMYEHTPEEGDEREARTREVRPEGEVMRLPSPEEEEGEARSWREGSQVSRKRGRSEVEEGEEDGELVEVPWGGGSSSRDAHAGGRSERTAPVGEGREEKRVRREEEEQAPVGDAVVPHVNGFDDSPMTMRQQVNGGFAPNGTQHDTQRSTQQSTQQSSGLVSPDLDNGSEEGEL